MPGTIAYRNIHLRSIPHTQQKKNGAIWFRGRREPSVNMRDDQRPKNGRRQWKWAYFGGPPRALTAPAMPRAAGVCNKGPSGLHKRARCVVLCTFTVKLIFWKRAFLPVESLVVWLREGLIQKLRSTRLASLSLQISESDNRVCVSKLKLYAVHLKGQPHFAAEWNVSLI